MISQLLVIIPHYWPTELGGVSQLTVANVNDIVSGIPGSAHRYATGYGADNCRNHALTESREKRQHINYEHVLFVDSDNGYRGDVVELITRMIALDKPIVGGAYPYRDGNHAGQYVCGWWHEGYPGVISKRTNEGDFDAEGIARVDWIGAGWLLVKGEVFSQIEYPYFWHPVTTMGEYADSDSEDTGFCIKCKQAGIPIYAYNAKIIHDRFATK